MKPSLKSIIIGLLIGALTTLPAHAATVTYPSGLKVVFGTNATVAGLNIGSVAGNPSTLANGDLWYNSTTGALMARVGGSSISLTAVPTTSAELRTVLTDESGTGAALFAGGNLGAATATSINGLTLTSSTGAITITNGKTLSSSNTLTLAGTDGSTLNIGTGGTLGTAAYTAATAYQPAGNYQAESDLLTAIADASSGTNQLCYYTGENAATTTAFTAFARTLVDDASADAARTTLGLDNYVSSGSDLSDDFAYLIKSVSGSTRAVTRSDWKVDIDDQMTFTQAAASLAGISVIASGDAATALAGSASHANAVGLYGAGTVSGATGIVAAAGHASAIPLKVTNSGGFAASITNAGTAARALAIPDESGTLATREWTASTARGLNYVNARDDFMVGNTTSGAIGDWGWAVVGLSLGYLGSLERHPGIVRLTSNGTALANLFSGYHSGGGPDELNGLTLEFCYRLDSITDNAAFIGIGVVNNWLSANGGYRGIHFDPALSANWRVLHRSNAAGGTNTFVDTGIAAIAAGWVYVSMAFTSGNTAVTLKTAASPNGATVSGTAAYTNTGGNIAIQMQVKSSSGNKILDMDAVAIYGTSTRL